MFTAAVETELLLTALVPTKHCSSFHCSAGTLQTRPRPGTVTTAEYGGGALFNLDDNEKVKRWDVNHHSFLNTGDSRAAETVKSFSSMILHNADPGENYDFAVLMLNV